MKERWLQAVALAISIGLAWYVRGESNLVVRSFSSPIEFRAVPNDRIITSPREPQAQIAVRGPSFLVSKIPLNPPAITLKLPDGARGSVLVPVTRNSVVFPPGVEVLTIEPGELMVTLDESIEKLVTVIVPRIGKLPEETVLQNFSITPEQVLIRGPKRILDRTESIESEPLNLTLLSTNTSPELQLRIPDGTLQPQVTKIRANAELAPITIERRIDALPIEVRALAGAQLEISPARVSVLVSGSRSALAALSKERVVPYVRLAEDGSTARVLVDAPQGIAVLSVEPETVRVQRPKKTR